MAYSQEQWDKAKVLFELGKSLQEISLETEIKDRTSISKKAKKESWVKSKIQQIKSDIVELEKDISTVEGKKSTLVEKLSKLEDYQITILNEVVEDEIKTKSLIFSTANLALIRANQALTTNTKTIMSKVEIYEDGKKIGTEYKEKEIPLSISDYKDSVDLIDKASITLGVNQRHSSSQVNINNTNAIQNNENKILTINDIYKD